MAPDPARQLPIATALGRLLFHSVGDGRIARRRARLRELPPRRPRRRAGLGDAGRAAPVDHAGGPR